MAAEKQDLTIKITNEYAGIISDLAFKVYNKRKKDALMYQLYNNIQLALKVDKFQIMKISGPYLMTYQEQLSNRDFSFFEKVDYKKQYKNEMKNYGAEIVDKIREIYSTLTQTERETMMDLVRKLLLKYIDYLELEVDNLSANLGQLKV